MIENLRVLLCVMLVCPGLAGREPDHDDFLTKEGVDAFYKICWQELQLRPPKIQPVTEELAKKELQGKFSYRYKDELSDQIKAGVFECKFPEWIWPDDHSRGKAMLFGDKIVLLGDGKDQDLRAFIVRIGGEWHIMQLDFPGGLVKLIKAKAETITKSPK